MFVIRNALVNKDNNTLTPQPSVLPHTSEAVRHRGRDSP